MKFNKIAKIVEGVPYTQRERGKKLYEHILEHRPENCLELGFAHGVASCYIAAALHELGQGSLTSVDLEDSKDRNPNIEQLLQTAGLQEFVTIRREKNSYNWFLKKAIEENTSNNSCTPFYDLCFIDGAKNWTIDGLAFFLVDKLLRKDGFVLFDDYRWSYGGYSKEVLDGITIRELSEDQVATPNIEVIFKLLVMQHPAYANFVVDEDWAWAQKISSDHKELKLIVSKSLRYRALKKMRAIINRN
ncbi:O-methyltransferase [Pseudomonadota bacterium]